MNLTPEEQQGLAEAPLEPRLTPEEVDALFAEIEADRLHRSRLERQERALEMDRELKTGY